MLDNLRELLSELFLGRQCSERSHNDMLRRPLHCTPYTGGYGDTPVGWIIAVEGSPPKGTLMIQNNFECGIRSHYIKYGSRRDYKRLIAAA
jgi:hypothetical protein